MLLLYNYYCPGLCAICTGLASLYNIILSQGPCSSNDTLGNTSFKLMLIKVFSVLSMLSKLPPAVCLAGGGGGGGGGAQACLIKEGGATGFLV